MKYPKNKFVIFISLIALLNCYFIFSKYDLKVFTGQTKPLNIYNRVLLKFKWKYPYPEIKTIGFYTDEISYKRIYILYELQDSIMPIFIDDSINHDKVLCVSKSNAYQLFAKKENMEITDKYNNIYLCTKKDKI